MMGLQEGFPTAAHRLHFHSLRLKNHPKLFVLHKNKQKYG